ncbi:hypothetical protein M3908_003506 [Vibrio metschnikovii]|nr:hypothetical protein [Vibrio metschnikovii]
MSFNLTAKDMRAFELEKELQREYEADLADDISMLCTEVCGWITTEDPDYLDAAIVLLHNKKLPIRGVLLDEVARLAKARLDRKIKVGTGNRKQWFKKAIAGGQGFYRSFPYRDARHLAFTLIEVCGLNTEESYRLVSKIIKRDHKKNYEKIRDKFGISMKTSLSARTIRRVYGKFKKTSEFSSFSSYKELFISEMYPNMTPEDIKNHLIQDLKDYEA